MVLRTLKATVLGHFVIFFETFFEFSISFADLKKMKKNPKINMLSSISDKNLNNILSDLP